MWAIVARRSELDEPAPAAQARMSTDDAFSDDDEFGDFEETQQTSTNIDITTVRSI